jgi:hypothetical protein
MGEYVRHLGSTVKLGTCEDLYYVSYLKYKAALQSSYLISETRGWKIMPCVGMA